MITAISFIIGVLIAIVGSYLMRKLCIEYRDKNETTILPFSRCKCGRQITVITTVCSNCRTIAIKDKLRFKK